MLEALIFDCDGVLAETERDGHRVANNEAFRREGIDAFWSVEEYGKLLKIAGGKERFREYFAAHPDICPGVDDEFIKKLHAEKTEIFIELTASGKLESRPGIERIIREAHEAKIPIFVCSTSQRGSVESLIRANYGQEVLDMFTELFCGDIVEKKKPAPDIYNLVPEKYGVNPEKCLVIEDTENGLCAAKAAGMKCVVTPSFYSINENFTGADLIVSSLGEVSLGNLISLAD